MLLALFLYEELNVLLSNVMERVNKEIVVRVTINLETDKCNSKVIDIGATAKSALKVRVL